MGAVFPQSWNSKAYCGYTWLQQWRLHSCSLPPMRFSETSWDNQIKFCPQRILHYIQVWIQRDYSRGKKSFLSAIRTVSWEASMIFLYIHHNRRQAIYPLSTNSRLRNSYPNLMTNPTTLTTII